MIPSQIITTLFTATVGGAITRFMQLSDAMPIHWFMLLYLIVFRTKQVLDDLVYYEAVKSHGTQKGEPFLAFCTWVLWIVAAFSITRPIWFFVVMGIIALLGVPWIHQAIRNVEGAEDANIGGGQFREDVKAAHARWNLANYFVLGGCILFVLVGLSASEDFSFKSGDFSPESNPKLWAGPIVLGITLLLDVITDWSFMFRLKGISAPLK